MQISNNIRQHYCVICQEQNKFIYIYYHLSLKIGSYQSEKQAAIDLKVTRMQLLYP